MRANGFSMIAIVAALSATLPAAALESFSLDKIQFESRETRITIPRVEFADTKITREEARTLFSAGAQRSSQSSVLAKLEASRIAIAEFRMESKSGNAILRNIDATGLKQGRFAVFEIAVAEGSIVGKSGAKGDIKVNALRVEDGDYSQFLTALEVGDMSSAVWRVGKVNFGGFDITVPEEDAPASVAGDRLYRIQLESFVAQNTYEGALPLKSTFAMTGLAFTLPRGSGMQRDLEQFGYSKLEIGAVASGTYNSAKKTYELEDFTLTGSDAGALHFTGSFASVEPETLMRGGPQRLERMLRNEVARFSMRFANHGLVEKAIAYYGRMQNRTPEQVKREFAAVVTGLGPMMLGGQPPSLALAQSVAEFVREPKSLSVTLKARGAPVRLDEIRKLSEPGALLALFDLESVANR